MDAKLSWCRFRSNRRRHPSDPTMKTFAPLSRLSKRDPSLAEKQSPIVKEQNRRTCSFRSGVAVASAAALALFVAFVRAAENGNWIGTWSASPQPVWDANFPAPINFPRNLWNQTIRQIARTSIGGRKVRVVLSNEYGSQPLNDWGRACRPLG